MATRLIISNKRSVCEIQKKKEWLTFREPARPRERKRGERRQGWCLELTLCIEERNEKKGRLAAFLQKRRGGGGRGWGVHLPLVDAKNK